MLKAVLVRLYPTKAQQEIIASQFGACRYIYNRSLALRKFVFERYGKTLSAHGLIKRIAVLKERHPWLKDADSQALQQSVRHMDEAYKHFFRRVKKHPKGHKGEAPGFPRFKSKHHSRQSYQYPQRVKIDGSRVYLPKVGWVKAKGLRAEFSGEIKTVTVSMEAYQYHAAILIDDGIETVEASHNGETVGLDMGVAAVVADSEGSLVDPIDFERELLKLRKCHQQLSRKQKGSSNRRKAKMRLAKQNLRIANIRKDFLHKLSTRYSENQVVVVEELNVKNMTKSAKGTEEKPGKNVRAKSGLNRSILKNGWGMFFEMLDYKTARRGGRLVKVSPEYTSQTCNVCGHVSKENRKSQSRFKCEACGHTANADINAAKNIRDRGMTGSNASQQTAA
jgi:putative transposase